MCHETRNETRNCGQQPHALEYAYKEKGLCPSKPQKHKTMASSTSLLLVSSLFLSSFFCVSEAQSSAPVVQGLSWNFYDSSCPKVDDIVRKQLKKVFKADIGQAAGLLRLHFHDCFVQVTFSKDYTVFSFSIASCQLFYCL